jgi:hypothetical protein
MDEINLMQPYAHVHPFSPYAHAHAHKPLMTCHHASMECLKEEYDFPFFLIRLSYFAPCQVATLGPCLPPLHSFPHHAPPFAFVVPTFLHLFPLSSITCLWGKTFAVWPFSLEAMDMSVFHRLPPP